MLVLRKARKLGFQLIQENFHGEYTLLMDRLSKDTYSALYGAGEQRLEITFPKRMRETDAAVIRTYGNNT